MVEITGKKIWTQLTEPVIAVQDPDHRSNSRFLACLLLAILPLGVMVAIVPSLSGVSGSVSRSPSVFALVGGIIFWAGAYVLSRIGRYKLAAGLAIVATLAIIHGNTLTTDDPSGLYFLIAPLLLSGVVLSMRNTLFLLALSTVGILLLPTLNPTLAFQQDIVGPLSLLLVGASFVLFGRHYQDLCEARRRSELEESEERCRTHQLAEETICHRIRELAALHETVFNVAARPDLSALLDTIVDQAMRLLDAQGGGLYFCDPSREEVRSAVSHNTSNHDAETVLKYGEGLVGTVARTSQPLIIDDYRDWEGQTAASKEDQPARSALVAPMIWQGQVTGVIHLLGDAESRRFTQADLDLLTLFTNHATIGLENFRLFEQAQREMTERQRAEGAIREAFETIERAKQEWESTADSLPDLICLLDEQGCIIRANQTVEGWNLGRVKSVSGQGFHRLLHPHCFDSSCYLDSFWRQAWEKTSRGQPAECEAYDELLERHVLVRIQPCEAEGRKAPRGSTVAVVRDVTERKLAEEDAERLRVFNESIVQGVAETILMEDAEGVLSFANTAAEKLLGYSRKELVGVHWSHLVPEDQRDKIRQEALKRPQGIESSYETAILSRGGEAIPVICSARPLFEEGEFVGTLSAFTDIREYKRMEEQMRVQDRLAAVGQLAAGIAHDFNNALTSIIGFAQLASMRTDVPEEAKVELQPIIEQGHRAGRMVRQILDFSRKSDSKQQPMDLTSFLKEEVKFLQRTIPESIQIIVDMGPEEYLVEGDPTQIHQVLTNLAVNARDAMPKGGELQFRLSRFTLETDGPRPFLIMQPGEWIVLSVSDTGMGIASDILPHIYEPFFTTKDVGEGTGLGLAQVYGIVTQHGGFIDVKTEVGEGTTFIIYLSALEVSSEASEEGLSEDVPLGHGETILLVEDELWVLEAGRAMLERLGYRVLAAPASFQALELYERHRDEISLVLADIVMPQMDGLQLFRTLSAWDPDVKVVLMTGYPLIKEGRELLEQGIIAWVQKPLDFVRLARIIGRSLGTE